MTDISFDEVENACIRALVKESGKFKSQNTLFTDISDNDRIKNIVGSNPILHNNLKYILLTVIRLLSTRNENIIVEDRNGILYACYSIDTSNINDKEIKYETVLETDTVKNNEMPSNNSVTRFIFDNKLKDFYDSVDFNGNTHLHNLIIGNDFEYITKYYSILSNKIDFENNDNKTPIELITDVRISNFFLVETIKKVKYIERFNESENRKLLNDIRVNKRKISSINLLLFVQFVINIILIFVIFESVKH